MKIREIKLMFVPVVLSVALSLGACADFLEETSESKRVMNNFYKTTEELEAGLLGVYATAKIVYEGAALGVANVGTDEVYAINASSNMGVADRYLYPASHNTVTQWYQRHFKIIQTANIIIDYAPKVPNIAEKDMNRIIGEAKVIRAWCYFRLVQTFGPVPVELKETTDISFRIRRNPIGEVYAAIIDDLKFAAGEGILPENITTGHVNRWVAKGMLAKVYLTLGTSMNRNPQPVPEYDELEYDPAELFGECLTLCDEIIASEKYSLCQTYGDIFLLGKKNGQESMWELQFSSSPGLGSNWSKQFGVQQTGNANAATVSCLVGSSSFAPPPSFYRYFKLGDSRRIWSIADYRVRYDTSTGDPLDLAYLKDESISDVTDETFNIDTDDPDSLKRSMISIPGGRLRVSKYRWGYGADPSMYWAETLSFESTNCPNNVIVLRYADILLMRIEADMLRNQGTAGSESLKIMNEQLLARARGWNAAANRYYTVEEMKEQALADARKWLDVATANHEKNPTAEMEAELAEARANFAAKEARCLVDYTAATLTYDELLTQRACELCFEFHRWFDLCRTGRLHTLAPARVVNPNSIPVINFNFEVNYLMPIPTYELDLAEDKSLFYQNYGY